MQPKIISEVKQLGFLDNGTGKHQSNTVYDENHISPSITTIEGGGTQQIKVLTEKCIVAMRGRNPENPSDRTVGCPTEQRLEPNSQGMSNTITSVQKDNLVLEKDVSALRMVRTEEGKLLRKKYENHEIKHGFNEHRIIEPRKDGVSNTLSTVQKDNMLLETVKIKQATKDGYIECQVGGDCRLEFP